MEVNKTFKIDPLSLDLTEQVIVVYPELAKKSSNHEYSYLRNRADAHPFLLAYDVNVQFNPIEFESLLYSELRKLRNKIIKMPEYTFYMASPITFLSTDYLNNVYLPKVNLLLKDYNNIIFLWDIENEQKKDYWGFFDIRNKAHIFLKSDVSVPFETEMAVSYFEVKAKSKQTVIEELKKKKIIPGDSNAYH